MAVGVDIVPPSVAATSLGQVVLPHATACYRTTREVLLSHGCTRLYTTPLPQHVGDCVSNSCVRALSLSSPILPSLSAAAQQNAYIDVWWGGMRACLCTSNTTSSERIVWGLVHILRNRLAFWYTSHHGLPAPSIVNHRLCGRCSIKRRGNQNTALPPAYSAAPNVPVIL